MRKIGGCVSSPQVQGSAQNRRGLAADPSLKGCVGDGGSAGGGAVSREVGREPGERGDSRESTSSEE